MAQSKISAEIKYHEPRTFALVRNRDITGVSGTGVVASGVVFSDGTTIIRWHGESPSTVVWDSMDAAMKIHGHNGATVASFYD